MKTTIGLITALLVCAATAHAQTPSFGIRAGVNLADLSFSSDAEVTNSKNLTGLVAGVFATVPLTDLVAFQPEALFSRQGTKFTEDDEDAKIKIDYFQVPLLGRFKFAKGSPVAVLIGPSLGFRSSAKLDVPGAPAGFDDDFEDEVERFDLGLVTGIGVDVGRLVLDGRYTWGLRNIAKNNEGQGEARNRVFSATVGVRF